MQRKINGSMSFQYSIKYKAIMNILIFYYYGRNFICLLNYNLSAYANKKELIMYINGHQFGGEYFEAAAIRKRES